MLIKLLKNRIFLLCAMGIITLSMLFFGSALGSVKFTFSEYISGLFSNGANGVIIRSLRLPRTVGALLSGAALAVAGLLLQSASDNPLAAPNTVGINSGAGAAVMISLVFIPSSFIYESLFAFFGALLASLLTLAVASKLRGLILRSGIVLSGVAVGAVFNAVIAYFSVRFPDLLPSYAAFSVGGFSGLLWSEIKIPAVIILAFLLFGMLLTPRLNILVLGDEIAESFGVRVKALRFTLVIVASALASASVSYAGLIGFVGLVAPHISEAMIGTDKRFLYPMTALFGASLTAVSDTLARVIFAPGELPSGIILNAIGAPFFLVLLIAKRRRREV